METTRINRIENLVSEHFPLSTQLKEGVDTEGYHCYKNKEITVYDCLFYLNILTSSGDKFSVHTSSELKNGYNNA